MNNKKIAIFSTSRSEFGIMKFLIKELKKEKNFVINFFVGGSHFLKLHGNTIAEIKKSRLKINDFFYYKQLNSNSAFSLSKVISVSTKKLAFIFNKFDFDYIIVFGDRYDLIPIITNAVIFNKIIIHVGGGETTKGAIDNQIRNMVTKAAHIHFTSSDDYSKKILSLGEKKNRIFNVGSLSYNKDFRKKVVTKKIFFNKFKLDSKLPLASLTFHPSDIEGGYSIKKKLKIIFDALNVFNINLIITAPNLEINSHEVIKIIKKNVKNKKNYKFYSSLGFENYHQLLKNSDFIIGNSSSGIIEAPLYKTPSINIGTRQDGRFRHQSVLDANYNKKLIIKLIKISMSKKFKNKIKKMKYKFGNGNSAKKISILLKKIKLTKKILLKE
jgi:GDP/UDP-N,N'-diacetylbacillosamine 2-epimerase (hydrolysing)